MFLVDTEGSMDVERNVEDGVKLSAFSMLLSSYQVGSYQIPPFQVRILFFLPAAKVSSAHLLTPLLFLPRYSIWPP